MVTKTFVLHEAYSVQIKKQPVDFCNEVIARHKLTYLCAEHSTTQKAAALEYLVQRVSYYLIR